jgi:hypothetical protein
MSWTQTCMNAIFLSDISVLARGKQQKKKEFYDNIPRNQSMKVMIRVKYKFICCWHKSALGFLFVLHHIRAVSCAFNFPFPLQSFCLSPDMLCILHCATVWICAAIKMPNLSFSTILVVSLLGASSDLIWWYHSGKMFDKNNQTNFNTRGSVHLTMTQ